MTDYTDHASVIKAFNYDQSAENDRRSEMRDVRSFLHTPSGQWESSVKSKMAVSYTFDRCNPLVDFISGEMEKNDFDIRITPNGSGATDKKAKRVDGLVRNIEQISNAKNAYKQAGRGGVEVGFDCVEVKNKYCDTDSFDQDLIIDHIPDSIDRVWFGSFEKETAEDAPHVFVLSNISVDKFDSKYKLNRKPVGIGKASHYNYEHYKRDGVDIGRVLYKEYDQKEIHRMSDGSVVDGEDLEQLAHLNALGITIDATRSRDKVRIMSRLFDQHGWLKEEELTPFKLLPVVPLLPNFRIIDGKVYSRGAIEKRMDEQRVLNYAATKQIIDSVLSGKEKLAIGETQASGREDELNSFSTSKSEVFIYNDHKNRTPPYKIPASQGSVALQQVIGMAEQSIEKGAGVFGVNPENNKGLQSDVALERLENRGQAGTYEYYSAQETMIGHIGKVCISAIPEIYPAQSKRTQRILNEDGSTEEIELGAQDDEGIIDLNIGKYDVTCSAGTAYQNRKAEANKGILEMAAIQPDIIPISADIMLKNSDAVGMDVVAERVRLKMVASGLIPENQMTEEEKQMLQAQAGNQEPDPMQKVAEAEALKAQTDAENSQIANQIKIIELQQQQEKLDVERESKSFDNEKAGVELLLKQQVETARALKDLSTAFNNFQGAPHAQREIVEDAEKLT